ncbi:MAG: cupin domain-containing protein [Planctomycetota bacterium]|jgi:quercetin dioxygenase-like cupin family protein/DNA-binding XRE family transcriptional regulator|nr:cupin domain-containing protein [Planctomycetota bacterium]
MSNGNVVGQRIRRIREGRQMKVEDLAAAIPGGQDANVKLIESLERGELVPSLTPLLQIARALGVRLGSFLDDQTGHAIVHTRAGEIAAVSRFVGSNLGDAREELNFHSLAANKNDRHMEPFLIDVKPHEGAPALSTHEGEEFIHVLEGEIEISYGKDTYLVKSGDSIYYDSIVPHHLHAAGNRAAKILAVVYAPF